MTVELKLLPTVGANQVTYVAIAINTVAAEFKLSKNGNGWENGSWELVVIDNDGDSNYSNGQIIEKGSYKMTGTCNGELYIDMHNFNFKRGVWTEQDQWDFGGDLGLTYTVINTTTASTSNGIDAVFKPNWDVSPMNVGDSWKQVDKLTEVLQSDYSLSGDITGSGKTTITNEFLYDYTWLVASKAQKVISNTWKGTTTFQDGYKLTRSGSFAWTSTEGTTTTSGITTPGPYEQWYAGDGDNFDACWAIDINGTTRIIYSTCRVFINTPPHFEMMPAPEGTINSDEAWVFKEGVDYAVSDVDPSTLSNGAGTLTYAIKKVLPDHTYVLKDLAIDSETGEITLTPTQKDVADGYQITINVTDNYDKGKLGAEATFTLNIKNKNHAPTLVSPPVMVDFTMKEGETNTPTWKLSDAFKDSDMDANPFMENFSYDPYENLTYTVSSNGSLRAVCPNGMDLTISNQCFDLRLIAIDGHFPRDQVVIMTFTATDKYGLNALQQQSVLVTHVNHAPRAIKNITDFEMDADTQASIDLKTIFTDTDVYNPNYITTDSLIFDTQGGNHLSVSITGAKATLKPGNNWCGEETIIFGATDKAEASATARLKVKVTGCLEPPVVTSFGPTTDPIISETQDGTEAGAPGSVELSVDAISPQNKILSYVWTVEDGLNIYTVTSSSAVWAFLATFDCDFNNGMFCGGTSSKSYIVTAYVTDGTFDIEVHKWYITVKNVNRTPELSGIEVFTVTSAGVKTPLTEKTPLNYTVPFGKVIELDVTNKVTDKDLGIADGTGIENLDKLSFKWTSSISGSFGSAADVKVGAGSAKTPATMALNAGNNVITVKVTDQNNQTATFTIMIKIGRQSHGDVQSFEGPTVLAAVIIVTIIMTLLRRK